MSDRIENDAYYTEPELARHIVHRIDLVWRSLSGNTEPPKRILEPSSGHGAFLIALREKYPNAYIVACDIDPDAAAYATVADKFVNLDFVKCYTKEPFDLCAGNPPFSFAEDHYHHGMSLLRDGGLMSFLLRVAFGAGVGRYERIWSPDVRHYCYETTLVPRPSFTGNSRTDKGQEYCDFMWVKGKKEMSHKGTPIVWRGI